MKFVCQSKKNKVVSCDTNVHTLTIQYASTNQSGSLQVSGMQILQYQPSPQWIRLQYIVFLQPKIDLYRI